MNPYRRREASRESLLILEDRVAVLEGKKELTDHDRQSALRISKMVGDVSAEFKSYHFSIVDQIEEEEEAKGEQKLLTEHELKVMLLIDRLGKIIEVPGPAEGRDNEVLRKRIERVEKSYRRLKTEVDETGPGLDVYALSGFDDRVKNYEAELRSVNRDLVSMEGVENLEERGTALELLLNALSVSIKRLIGDKEETTSSHSSGGTIGLVGVQLPRIEIPKFDGNILNWRAFWEQFESSVHSKSQLTDSDKLIYLRDALKDSPAKTTVLGLTQTSDSYCEAIKCLQERYDRPRVVHQAHVRKIQEAYPMKSDSGQELRRIHDLLSQHTRALKAADNHTLDTYLTAAIELKLHESIKLKWTEYSSKCDTTPPYTDLLEFLDLQARHHESVAQTTRKQATSTVERKIPHRFGYPARPDSTCLVCNREGHPLHSCAKFQGMSRDERWEVIKKNGLCLNCLRGGHMANKCRVPQTCKKCNRRHHTLLHIEDSKPPEATNAQPVSNVTHVPPPRSNKQVLLMTCRARITSQNGVYSQARVFLDPGAACSFITERMAQQLRLPRRKSNTTIAGIGGISAARTRGAVSFILSHARGDGKQVQIDGAFVLPKITTDMPISPVPSISEWSHLSGLELADPDFGTPARIDVLLGADYYGEVLTHGRRWGARGTPYAQKTCFGWVLAGPLPSTDLPPSAYTCCFAMEDNALQKFWEIEDHNMDRPVLTQEERAVVQHFESSHSRDSDGRYIVPLPRKLGVAPLGESREKAVTRFTKLERSLRSKGQFQEFAKAMQEYFNLGHAEPVPPKERNNTCTDSYYLPMHVVRKEDSSTSKVRVVFDASANTTSGTSLNDHFLVGPTVHPSLIDVLLRFRQYRVALTTDVSRMYRAVRLSNDQKDLHRFVWREHPQQPLVDYRMTRLTFGVSASSFAANMALKQNALNYRHEYPKASLAALTSFYVDDALTGEDSIEKAVQLRRELQSLFERGGFKLRKWRSSERDVLATIPPDLIDPNTTQELKYEDDYTKILGVEWNTILDCFRPMISLPEIKLPLTKRALVSNIARLFDILGWCSPAIITMKILLQRLWESHLDWDEPVPDHIERSWMKWYEELPQLRKHTIPRPYFPKDADIIDVQLHGFSDASEVAYSGVVYLRAIDKKGAVHTALVMAKTKVAPIKRLSVPRLELCGSVILAKLLKHVASTLGISLNNTFAWTDSCVVLGWLRGNPRRFKTFVGNRIAEISEVVPVERWRHVPGTDNPADCASRGLYPAQLTEHDIWWYGPTWLKDATETWDVHTDFPEHLIPSEERETPQVVLVANTTELPLLQRVSSYDRLMRITAWIFRFTNNCRNKNERLLCTGLKAHELGPAEEFWWQIVQRSKFGEEITHLEAKGKLKQASKILTFHPLLDSKGLLRVGGRIDHANLPYSQRHPLLIPGDHALTKLLISSEHKRLLHAGPTSVSASLSRRFCILNSRRAIRSIVRSCVKCRKTEAAPSPQIFGQLPVDRLRPGPVFDCVGVDYAGPVMVKSGPVRRPVLKKAYVAVFVCFTTKAVHLELVSDLTTSAFLAALRRFIGRRGIPSTIWSDHGSNFVGAEREIRELVQRESSTIEEFCATQRIKWKFTPEHAPHFGGLWEAAVRSFKKHVRKVLGETKLNFEEFTTVLTQVEGCLNSRPLIPLPDPSDGLEVLTPGHFLVGRPLMALPDEAIIKQPPPLRRWQLCQTLNRHWWTRWSKEYLKTLLKISKWHTPTRNIEVGDIVCLRDEPLAPTKWPLARVIEIHQGRDGKTRVVTVRTAKGVYKRPIVKIVPLVNNEN